MEEPDKVSEKEIEEGIAFAKKRAMLASLQELETSLPEVEIEKEAVVKKINIFRWASIAAGFLLLATLCWWIWLKPVPLHEKLFVEHFEPYPAVGLVRGNASDDIRTQAVEAYNKNDFATAASLFSSLYENNQDTLSLFYASVAQLGNGETETAIAGFEEFKGISSVLREEADFYVGLGNLRMGEIEKVENITNAISEKEKKEKLLKILEHKN